ncbi:(E)-2-epi-beta-caryophyllene synthase-like [Selaginella moellendorffii]|uniref:(E)-2-epi-beta-caryophyllene synthase-like n=1 Tax=Selaginella moellendorffii TaxID=88036 RepID=UPI000D1C31CC|nr:(E)-2-epi-beta-caryophyllene synthase-like [Selaginella moellendorffii]|eukprot:XP_024519167.1 (E)-2-epi-beta-caryophyllene synthase-like [Selaginella moellendorffii]
MASPCLQKLPAVEHLFALTPEIPFQRHPEYMSITKEANEWAFKCMRRDFSPEEKKCLVQWKVPMFTCLSTPHAPKANMVASAKFAWLTAFLNDPFDDNEVAAGALATSYLDTVLSLCYGTASLAEVPDILAYRACHDLMEDLRSLLKPELFKRTVSTVEGWARSISSDDLTQDYELYRRKNVFILPLIYAMGASFDDEDVESLDYIRAQNAMLDHMWMVNDVFSFPKEFYKKKFNNLPAVLLLTDPSVQTFQDAVNTTCRMIQDKEDEFIYYRDILATNASRNGKKDFLKFLDVLSCTIPANLVFHYASSCYHGMDNPLLGGGTFRGTWILDPKRTIIVSDPKRCNVVREALTNWSTLGNRQGPAPLLIHMSTEACKVAGYDIPKGTSTFVNCYTIGRDPAVREDAL